MSAIHELKEGSRLVEVLYDNLTPAVTASPVYATVDAYLAAYLSACGRTPEEAVAAYSRFIAAYHKDCRAFIQTGLYPLQRGAPAYAPSRWEYDVVLLCSILLTRHRFRIMESVVERTPPGRRALYIGVGSGVEIALTRTKHEEATAYDISVNPSVQHLLPDVQWTEGLYVEPHVEPHVEGFDVIYMVELLEHVEAPLDLVRLATASLAPGGHCVFTTAIDIPQFDHMMRFNSDTRDFESRVAAAGLEIIYKERILHEPLSSGVVPCNDLYVGRKR